MVEVVLTKKNNNNIELINNINSISKSLRLYKIVTCKEDILEIISNNTIDILIIEYNIFKNLNIIDFSNITIYVKSVIILTNDSNINYSKNKKIPLYSNEHDIPILLKKYLQENSIKEKNHIINKISNELKYLGYNPAYYGTKYLIDCIYYLYIHNDYCDEKTIKSIYKILAKQYNKNENNIKCNITRATSIMFCECEETRLKQYLGMCSLPKTGSKIIIQTILNKLNYS